MKNLIIAGKMVFENRLKENISYINTIDFSDGIYTLQLIINGVNEAPQKLIIVK